jgi:hypothetical protein
MTTPIPDLPTATLLAELVASLGLSEVVERLGLCAADGPAPADDARLAAFVNDNPWARARLVSLARWQQRRTLGRGRRRHGDDLRGLGTAIVTATTGVTDVVQGMHDAIAAVPLFTGDRGCAAGIAHPLSSRLSRSMTPGRSTTTSVTSLLSAVPTKAAACGGAWVKPCAGGAWWRKVTRQLPAGSA